MNAIPCDSRPGAMPPPEKPTKMMTDFRKTIDANGHHVTLSKIQGQQHTPSLYYYGTCQWCGRAAEFVPADRAFYGPAIREKCDGN